MFPNVLTELLKEIEQQKRAPARENERVGKTSEGE
jgi:hypothetical protein